MPRRSPTMVLLRDELIGYARSKVMIVLWVIMPLIAIFAYLALPAGIMVKTGYGTELTAAQFMSVLLGSIAGTVAALVVSVDIVAEKNRKVYELFVIRPIKRETIIWAKFLGVTVCVLVACIVSIFIGIAVDAIRGDTPEITMQTLEAFAVLANLIALSAAVGVIFGVLTKSILVAVILILYVGQNLAVVPMLPQMFGVLPDGFWIFQLISAGLVLLVMWVSALIFRRSEY